MKITSITPQIFASNKTQNKQSFVSAKAEKTYGGDVFVKSVTAKNVSFGANLTMAEKFIPFKNEFLKYYKENSILTFDEIEKIIQKYLPDIKVCDLSTMQNKGNVHNRTGAYFENEILFTSDMKCKKGIQQICLIPQKTDKFEEKMQLAQGVIHEMTHALQENSKDRLSKDDFLNSLKGAEKNPYEFIEMLLKEQTDSEIAVVLANAKDKFNTLTENDEYLFDETKDVKQEVMDIKQLLSSFKVNQSLINAELKSESLFVFTALEFANNESAIRGLLVSANQTVVLKALEMLKQMNSLTKEDKNLALSSVTSEDIKSVIVAI